MEVPTEPTRTAVASAARRALVGFGVREIGVGVVALAVIIFGARWAFRHSKESDADRAAIRAQLAMRADAADVYRERIAALRNEADQIRTWAEAQTSEPQRTWARERLRRMDALLSAVDREADARQFAVAAPEIAALAARGDIAGAKARLAQMPSPVFPPPSEFARMRHSLYAAPLTEFSRQNPELYRTLRQFEPELAQADEKALRAEINAAEPDRITPQLMLKVDLLAAVASSDDPIVAEWSALISAIDFFENPDGATLARWRRAQQAARANDWPTATAEMQAIVNANVRTRQPFRAALGRALLKSRPDQPSEAYPYLLEAAATGDKAARVWVAQEDLRQQRYAQAQRWLEAAAADGDGAAIPALIDLYSNHGDAISPDLNRRVGVLERVADRPEASADAWLILGKLYEQTDPVGGPKKAFACYRHAAAKGSAAGSLAVARDALRGSGTAQNPEQARDAAIEAFRRGEQENAAVILAQLMQRVPERTASALLHLFGEESVAGGGGYMETRVVDGPGVMQLKAQLARYLDQVGQYGQAARFYGALRDPEATHRHAELTAAHPCQTCGGTGKVQDSVPCPTCNGKGKQICSYCGGDGFIFVPGTPPCTTCGGTGTMLQDNKVVACSACGGTGKGKGSVIKQDCTHCEHGYIRCATCNGTGTIKVTKDCPDCHGRGTWTMVDKGSE